MAACTNAPPPPSPLPIAPVQRCPLTECELPARHPISTNEQWPRAVDALEESLTTCAAQVLDCMKRQELPRATPSEATMPAANVPGHNPGS
ncbi:Rz1-like lysis system protein LysC [Pseudomonas nitroreducens]|uniref:Rz1-like lysis system protein LysC n=1 Tax=Pseudomonas nitroreducens TaxID=46680 RepID=UPI00345F4513